MGATYDQTAAIYARQRENKLRELLRRDYGARKYRLAGNDVHIYGKMPNTNIVGWYVLGSREYVERDYQL